MKKQFRPVIPVLVVAVALIMSLVYQAHAVGPKVSEPLNRHNLSASNAISGFQYKATNDPTGNPRGQEICVFCHTPHNANMAVEAPLWNRKFTTFESLSFRRFTSATLQINRIANAQFSQVPDGSSKLCLSCHDGATRLGEVNSGAEIAMANKTVIEGVASFHPNTNKLKSGHHPVSFTFDASVRDSINAGRLPTSQVKLPDTVPQVKLRNGKMQCTTCHEAHQNQSNDNDFYPSPNDTRKIAPFWVYGVNNNGSADQQAVCTACHPMDTFTTPWP